MEITIQWKQKAIKQFAHAIEYIEKDSFMNARKFEKEILDKIDDLLSHPEKHPSDKLKINNDGSYRAFELYSYRISYRYVKNQIRILQLRHTKRLPLKY